MEGSRLLTQEHRRFISRLGEQTQEAIKAQKEPRSWEMLDSGDQGGEFTDGFPAQNGK